MSITVKIEDLLTEQYKGKRKDTGTNAFLCLEDVTTCINYTFGFVGRSVAGCSDAPTGLRLQPLIFSHRSYTIKFAH